MINRRRMAKGQTMDCPEPEISRESRQSVPVFPVFPCSPADSLNRAVRFRPFPTQSLHRIPRKGTEHSLPIANFRRLSKDHHPLEIFFPLLPQLHPTFTANPKSKPSINLEVERQAF